MNRNLDGTELTRAQLIDLALRSGMSPMKVSRDVKTHVFHSASRQLRWEMWCRGELVLDTRPIDRAPTTDVLDWDVIEFLTTMRRPVPASWDTFVCFVESTPGEGCFTEPTVVTRVEVLSPHGERRHPRRSPDGRRARPLPCPCRDRLDQLLTQEVTCPRPSQPLGKSPNGSTTTPVTPGSCTG